MTTREELIIEVKNQREWIAKCGGNFIGYIRHYGSKDDPEHNGNGGEATYQADITALENLLDKCRRRGIDET